MKIFKNHLTLKQVVIAYLPPVLWATVIFLFSSQSNLPGFAESAYDYFLKKLAHIFVYFILYFLVSRAIRITIQEKQSLFILYLPIIICLIYATSDELHQAFVPGRFATIKDIGYDLLGVSLAFLKKYGYV